MKKTLTINLSGVVFHIDEDAYEFLYQYLAKIRTHFSKEEGCDEILWDIENRIAETLQAKLSEGRQVITLADVREVIGQLGEPEQIDNEAEPGQGAVTDSKTGKGPRRLYRNPDGAILGGVAGGLAAYFQIDTTLVRLAFVLFAFVGGFSIITYLVMWIVVPRANTTAEKLEMKGEEVNISNIEKSIKEELEEVKKNVKNFSAEAENAFRQKATNRTAGEAFVGGIATGFGVVIKTLAKVFVALVGLFFLFTGIFLLIGFIWVLAGGPIVLDAGQGLHAFSFKEIANLIFTDPTISSISLASLLLLTVIPIIAMLYTGILLIVGTRARIKYFGRIGITLWLVGLGMGLFSLASGTRNYLHQRTVTEVSAPIVSTVDTLEVYLNTGRYSDIDVMSPYHLDSWDLLWTVNNGYRHLRPEVRIVETSGEQIEVIVYKIARGYNPQVALQNAESISYAFTFEQNRLILDPFFAFAEADGWRAQRVTIEILVPASVHVYLSSELKESLDIFYPRSRMEVSWPVVD
jgi:phage shock protein PspC (stress-responsive transcriptional regulator)